MKTFIILLSAFVAYWAISSVSADERMCPMIYAPICAKVQVQCVKAPCYPVYKTFANSCMMSNEAHATEVHSWACTAFEEWRQAVLSEMLKSSLKSQYDEFISKISLLDTNAQIAKLQNVRLRLTEKIDELPPNLPGDIFAEMKIDRLRNIYLFVEDMNNSKITDIKEILSKRYLFKDPIRCEGVKFKCNDWETAFFDDIGCGCKSPITN
ncbi:MAG: hypothetical protein ACD_2C00156G0010 [uncultured bacterium (gcode 4)]|uniref:Kazal-like domain-containing protein n=1 Tax=uncultured bacterium (gcode 4) TaxID=1234023 RepID=K2H0Z4_9BACT|nr:MAG: hypothetical protein ACD_2C00156G0010 [uncultured bacterium (gcode 4)]